MPKNKKPNRLPRKKSITSAENSWREFEKLVSRIEAALCPKGALVKSPDKLIDNITQELREVDASIRYKVGTTEILIIIECRERKKIEDSMWIEQLASKQKDVGAAKCIAVTSTGFTIPALKKANSLGIEVRRVKRINEEIILKWAPFRTWFYNYKLLHVDIGFAHNGIIELNQALDDELNREMSKKYKLEDNFLRIKGSDKRTSVKQYIEDVINVSYNSMSDEEKLKIEENKEYVMSIAGEPRYSVECTKGIVDVIGITFKIIFKTFKDYSIKPTTAFYYSDGKKDLVEGFEFDMNSRTGEREKLTIHKDLASMESKVSIWSIDE